MKRNWPVSGLYAVAAGMQLCWLGATLDLANQNLTGGSLPILDILVFYPLAFGFSRLLPARRRLVGVFLCWMAWGLAVLFLMKVHFYEGFGLGNFFWLAELGQAMGRMFHAFNPEGLMVLSIAVL
jgi:hypothetical protein